MLPRIAPWFFRRYGDRVIEPEIKLVFASLLVLMVLADASNGHAVLPAFVLGLMMSRDYEEHREEQAQLRVVAFSFVTPFLFLKGGLNSERSLPSSGSTPESSTAPSSHSSSPSSSSRPFVPTAIAERRFLHDPERERHQERRHAPFPPEEYV